MVGSEEAYSFDHVPFTVAPLSDDAVFFIQF